MIITLLGLGEAGRLYAEGFAESGAEVHGYDPFVTISSGAVEQHSEIAAAVAPANVVISLVGAKAAGIVGGQAFPYLAEGAVYADFNTASPSVKSELSVNAASAGVLFADVAVLAPVPRAGSRTPLMASGSGADELHRALSPLGVPIESIGGEAGAAASRKLLRSVFMKGLAGVVLEAAEAGRESGNEDWIKDQMAAELGPDGAELVDRLIAGSHAHAERRQHEIQDAVDYVTQLGTPSWMSVGALRWLSSLAAQEAN